jgi:hypothetical protein
MIDISHEEIGDACDWCGNSDFMCDCRPCKVCKDKYAPEDMPLGLCPDCQDDFDSNDLENKLERAFNI